MNSKSKISVLLSPQELQRFEAYCTETGHKKSPLVARLIRDHMNAAGFQLQTIAASESAPGRRENSGRRAKGRSTKGG